MTNPRNRPELVVTGLGVVCAAGASPEALWDSAWRGDSPATWWPEDPRGAIAVCRVPRIELPPDLARRSNRSDRCAQLALAAARQAWQSAALGLVDPERIGCVVGSARGPVGKIAEAARQSDAGAARPTLAASGTGASISGLISVAFGLTGPCMTVSASCASAGDAIALGAQWVLAGEVDLVLAGGAEAPLIDAVVGPFRNAGILGSHADARQTCRPFDVSRNGILLGEGAAFLVIEKEDTAARRGVRRWARLLGWGLGADGLGRTAPCADGRGLYRVLGRALRMAGKDPEQVGYFNAHGTGTRLNDACEAVALERLLGERVSRIPCSSTKPITGHCLGATPALEAVLSIMALRHQRVPPTVNCRQLDPGCRLDVVRGAGREVDLEVAVSQAQGFWGNNAALVLGKV